MMYILFGVVLGVWLEQMYGLPNLKESFQRCSKTKEDEED